MTRRVEGNPYRVYRHPETGHWCLGRKTDSIHAPMEVAVTPEGIRAVLRQRVDGADRHIDRIMEELASARFRRDAFRDLLDYLDDEDDS